MTKKLALAILILGILSALVLLPDTSSEKIEGICMVAPARPISKNEYDPVLAVNAEWVAIIPYAFCRPDQPKVVFDHPRQWWGERRDGVIKSIAFAQSKGLKIMLKPHLWVMGQGWAGDLTFSKNEDLKTWQTSYREYLLQYVSVADSMNVEMLSIGTELRKITTQDPEFWNGLIQEVRQIYKGQITYCANWDNYDKISFWDELDYIGIDAYFPFNQNHTPSVEELVDSYQEIVNKLEGFSAKTKKSILFTEFGFRSMDRTAGGHWELEHKNVAPNMTGQRNAYEAIFNSIWLQEWFAGGFVWKWHYNHKTAGGIRDSHFTPQNKPAEEVIRSYFKKK